ncbi:MAG: hypothetical protein M3416_04460 [Acidobacteriota bacterium]|nr:hypothetical protein [Acidobacteriota bacterium]
MKRDKGKQETGRRVSADKPGPASKPVSLAPLDFDTALDGLLATDAEAVRELERKAEAKREAKKK